MRRSSSPIASKHYNEHCNDGTSCICIKWQKAVFIVRYLNYHLFFKCRRPIKLLIIDIRTYFCCVQSILEKTKTAFISSKTMIENELPFWPLQIDSQSNYVSFYSWLTCPGLKSGKRPEKQLVCIIVCHIIKGGRFF